MKAARTVCIVTGSRAEYGLLYSLIKGVSEDPDLNLQLIVTGMHLSPDFGLTYEQIEADGFKIDARVETLLSSDSPVGTAKSVGLGVIGIADELARLKPDILVLLGDRFETFAAAQAAMFARIPIAHIHGGESTEGAVDEAIRHSVSKMAHLHFTAAEPYRQRILQLGESPDRVFNTGAIGLDNLATLESLERPELEHELGFALQPGPLILCTYHPVTLREGGAVGELEAMLQALDALPSARVVFTKGNADTFGRTANAMIDRYVANNATRSVAFSSLGQLCYLSLMREADVVLGNSSSGIIEAPAARTPTVNIGERQTGRLKAPSIIDCGGSSESIAEAINTALSPEYQELADQGETVYGEGGVAEQIKEILKRTTLDGILFKRFYDLPTT